jgi:two-component system, OmpR family, sensor histidine kinase VicK
MADNNNAIDPEEYKKVTEQMYTQNLELARLNKQIDSQKSKIESQKTTLEELLRIKEETLHIVNHQMNTPISIIRSSIDMFEDKIWDEKKFLDVVKTETDRLSETIGQFLAARNVDTENLKINKTKNDFPTIVKNIIEEKKLLKKVRENKIELIYTSDFETLELEFDVGKITEVVSNLLDNAINYSTSTIFINITKNEKGLIFAIKDSGIGIPKESIGQLFKRFMRLDNAKKTRPDGTGLGLYVCQQIIQAHKGFIWAESEGVGKGSIFFVNLPI